jgi:GAF domain-containing protein
MTGSDARLLDALRQAAVAAELAAPAGHLQLLRMIVEAAAHVIGAKGGSLLLLDAAADELVFEVAVGSEADELSGLRLAVGEGIAGLVAASGQPMAISDAASDSRVSDDIARTIGYVPDALLCVPLIFDDRVIGVLELVDKHDGTSFTGADMQSLALFANQAAVAIRQSRMQRQLTALIDELLASEDGHDGAMRKHARELVGQLEDDEEYQRIVAISTLVREIANHGEEAARACHDLLTGFAAYLRSQAPTAAGR